MRTLKRACLAGLMLVLGVATANASTISVVWQMNGQSTILPGLGPYVADIVLTIGLGDTPIGGTGAGIEVSADYTTGVGSYVSSAQILLAGWITLANPVDNGIDHVDDVVAQGDFFGTGQTIAAGSSVTIGTITVFELTPVHPWLPVVVSNSGPSDDIYASSGVLITSEFTFLAGTIIPEPATAGLLGLGLLALGALGRRGKA